MISTSWYRLTIDAGTIVALVLDSRLAALESARGATITLADEADLIALARRQRRALTIRKRLNADERERYFRAPALDWSLYALAS
jgi:hypothetical protein